MINLNEQGHARRQWLNRIMLGLSGTAAAIAILILVLILGYTLVRGISYINLNILIFAAKPMGGAKACRVAAIGAAFEHRMADIAAGEPDPLEIRRLKRQQRHQMVVPPGHAPSPAGAPRPHHRRHVMDKWQPLAVAAQPLGDTPAETGAVDRHHGIGL